MAIYFRYTAAFLAAVLCTSLLSSFMSSQSVIASLQELGIVVPFTTRLTMTFIDFKILQSLLPVVSVSFLLGFLVAALCRRFVFNNKAFWFTLAGFSSFICALLIMNLIFQLMPIAGARTLLGLAIQGLTGAIGGYLFSRLSVVHTPSSSR